MKKVSIKLLLTTLLFTASLGAMQHPEGKTSLHLHAIAKRPDYILNILENYKTPHIDARDIYGNTPLHEACYFGCFESVCILLDFGANINAVNKNGLTPVDKAFNGKQEAILELLLEYGGVSGQQIAPGRVKNPVQPNPVQKPKHPLNPIQPAQKKQPVPQPAKKIQPNQKPAYQPMPAAPKHAQPTAPKHQPYAPSKAAIAPCIYDQRDLLHLPGLTGGALKLPGVYHVYSEAPVATDKGWACAFHSLDNMRQLEYEICGRQISDQTFINACTKNCTTIKSGSNCIQQYKIAQQMGLPYMINLEINDQGRGTEIVFKSDTYYEWRDGESEEYAYQRAERNRQDQEWNRLVQLFKTSREPICIHFCAGIMSYLIDNPGRGEGHGIDISVIKDKNGAVALYIFDNINDAEARTSQDAIRRHVEFIYRKFIA